MRGWIVGFAMIMGACGGDDGGSGVDAAPVDASVDSPSAGPITAAFVPLSGLFPQPPRNFVQGTSLIYATTDTHVVASSNDGFTFTDRAAIRASELVATSQSLFALVPGTPTPVLRSTDGALTFAPVNLPAGVPPETFVRMAATPSALWIETRSDSGPSQLFRSVDEGASFTAVPPPAVLAATWQLATGGDYLFLYVTHNPVHVFRTLDATSWDDLGEIPAVETVAGTRLGTALAIGRDADSHELLYRRARTDTTWSTSTADQREAISARTANDVYRVWSDGTDLHSTDDGVTWLAGTAAPLVNCVRDQVVALRNVLVGTCYDDTTPLAIRLPIGAMTWQQDEPTQLVPPLVDVAFSPSGAILLAGRTTVFRSTDHGDTWHRSAFRTDSTTPVQALATSQDDTQIFVGGPRGLAGMLDWQSMSGALQPLFPATERTVQAQWRDTANLFVTTTTEQSDQGALRNYNPTSSVPWSEVFPFRTEGEPRLDPPAGYYGLSACGALVIGVEQTTVDHGMRILAPGVSLWSDLDAPVENSQPLTLSCAPNGTQALLFVGNELFVGTYLGPRYQALTPAGVAGTITVAKFDLANHLWLIVDGAVYRSQDPIDAH